jgi:phosphate uptake regulator
MAVATERIVVQVTPAQKKAINSTAKRLGLNVSELMRQAVKGFQTKSDNDDLEALIERVNLSSKEASDALDDALAFVRKSNKRLAAMNKEDRS